MQRKRKLTAVCLTLAACVLGLIVSCGGGGGNNSGGASTMEISVVTGTSVSGGIGFTTYTEGYINKDGYYDPSFSGDCSPTMPATLITMCSGVYGGAAPCDILINIRTAGMTPGGYSITGGTNTSTNFMYMDQAQYYDSIVSKGTITLTSVGKVGEPIVGTFDAVLGLRSDLSTTMGVSGTFSVIRDH